MGRQRDKQVNKKKITTGLNKKHASDISLENTKVVQFPLLSQLTSSSVPEQLNSLTYWLGGSVRGQGHFWQSLTLPRVASP